VHIYLDESGNFAIRKGERPRVCGLGALVVPSSINDEVLGAFGSLRDSWHRGAEVKGSALGEREVASVIALLQHYDCLFEACAIHTGLHTPKGIALLKREQGDRIVGGLTEQHHPNIAHWLHDLRAQWLALPDQLAIQLLAVVVACEQVLRYAPVYYAQRQPAELGAFHWRIDAKDKSETRYEKVLRQLVLPFLQSTFLQTPAISVDEFDFSHFRRFEVQTGIPDYLKYAARVKDEARTRTSDLRLIMTESWRFESSRESAGLQIVDILTSALCRAMNGRLRIAGWGELGSLIVQKPKGEQCLRHILLRARTSTTRAIELESYEGFVTEALCRRVKTMFTDGT
jgi:hypothetical protein